MKNRSVLQMLAIAFAVCLAYLGMQAQAAAQSTCAITGTIPIDGGQYIFQNNEWNSSLEQCATVSGVGFTLTTANFNTSTDGGPATYPSIYMGCHWGACTSSNPFPIEESNIASASSSVTITQPAGYNNDASYDIWFNQSSTTTGQPNGTEIMIWINHQGTPQPAGSDVATVTINGASYQVWTGTMPSWNIVSYVAVNPVTSVANLNLLPFFADAVSRGSLKSSWWLLDVEYGFEVWSGGEGLGMSGYSVSAAANNGGTCATVPSAPSGLTATAASTSVINLSWTADTAPANCTIGSYNVYGSTTANFTPSSSNLLASGVTATSYSNTGLAAATTHYYAIEAVDAEGTSAASAEASAETSAGVAASFTLSRSASALSVTQGASATDTVSVIDAGGFTGSVTLAASGLPSGVTAAFAANPTTSTSVLTLTASSTATAGISTVTITGTSGSLTATTTIALTITAPVSCTPTAIVPYLQVGTAAWQNTNTTTVTSTTTVVNLGPQPIAGTWAWTGPNGYTSSARQINAVPLGAGANVYVATYTNASNCKSTETFTITAPASTGSFKLTPSAASLSIVQGASGTDTITVTDTAPFAGSVTLAASGLPSGVTAAFATNPTTGTSVLTLTASSTAATGSSTVTITGTSGSLSATATIALTVNAVSTGSFKLAASASSLSIAQGASGTDTITLTDTAPFAGSVTLAASGLPAGVTAAFATNPATSTSVLTLSASSTATTGTSTVTITGTSGALTATTTISLTVTAATVTGSKCTVDYVISPQNTSAFGATLTLVNNSSTAWTSWTLTWAFANGQTISSLWNGIETQSGANVTVTSESYNGSVAAGGSVTGIGFNGTWNGASNAIPTAFSINGTACTVN